MEMEIDFKSGFVAIIGKPNAGKSTIMNAVLGEKIAAVTHKPNTTRNRIHGIHSTGEYQMVFLDTPGIHLPSGKVNKFMVNEAFTVFGDADVICFVVTAGKKPDSEHETIIKHMKSFNGKTILVINKTDLVSNEQAIETQNAFKNLCSFDKTVMISAINNDSVKHLEKEIYPLLPGNAPYFPLDILTTSPEKDICAEFIREKIFLLTGQELPYSCAVMVSDFSEYEDLIEISAEINVERDSQKGMIIGKGGKKIKEIGIKARGEIEKLLGIKVFLDLRVRVQKNWSKDDNALERFGYKKGKKFFS